MKLTFKLPLAFASALALLLLAALYGIFSLNQSLATYATTVHQSEDQRAASAQATILFKVQVQEWKNTLLRGRDPAALDKHWSAFQRSEGEVSQATRRLINTLAAGPSKSSLEHFATAHAEMGAKYRTAFEQFKAAACDPLVGDRAVKGLDREPTRLLDEATAQIAADAESASTGAADAAQRATATSVGLMLVVCALGLVGAVLFSRTITRPLARAVAVARTVASGDLTTSIESSRQDETGQLLTAMRDMQAGLQKVVGAVRENSESVATASAEIAQANQDLSHRTESQASALQETAASMEQLGSTVRQNTENARDADRLAQEAAALAGQGGEVVKRAIETMSSINDSSKRIAEIIGVIDGIAFQTNILALNAAVEAARAGEQGRGFAVVASEVRNLAGRSASAAKEIRQLIHASVERVEQGSDLVDRAGSAMADIVASIHRVSEVVSAISAATREQGTGVHQVSQAVTQMDQATQQNAALVEEGAAASESLRDQAQRLTQVVASFQLPAPTARV